MSDDATARCLVVLKQVKGFPRDQAENAVYLMELREEFPLVDPVEVCRAYRVWMRDNPGKAKNYRSRLRTFFARKTNDLEDGDRGGRGAGRGDFRRRLGGAKNFDSRI
ncbi:MAG: hypothetical protein AVDCRST_MAG25-3318 [uncultured Rubrobacteraceae bacterium]|uniref:Uncharacterized protein n=1 Tax=uncultured Rubrobacteraceae bacterium TaxID=349277 RepID=A0A6J4SC07_9ACTN|nr:MAG: hypothetical protein AVDCRST_MAG25-3318 [uncultured Rubrobacteraceae bacterium]